MGAILCIREAQLIILLLHCALTNPICWLYKQFISFAVTGPGNRVIGTMSTASNAKLVLEKRIKTTLIINKNFIFFMAGYKYILEERTLILIINPINESNSYTVLLLVNKLYSFVFTLFTHSPHYIQLDAIESI